MYVTCETINIVLVIIRSAADKTTTFIHEISKHSNKN